MANDPISFRPGLTNSGLIFGSLSFPDEKANFNGYFLQVKLISADNKNARKNLREIKFSPKQVWKMQHRGELDNGLTYVFALDLPEGDYEISGIRLFSNSGVAALQRHDVLSGFSIPFTIIKGNIKYVGNIQFNENTSLRANIALTHKNEFEKDLEAIKSSQPYIIWDSAENADLKMTYK
ncbi:MAG: hypothetical protein ITG00_09230 [Flavobacterium sp.]|nr:hypothetical protein [Flavobacterium sp.]